MAGRGGLQQPQRPAAVSNPQSGARTDGGAGSKSQPIRTPTGGAYGEAGALTAQQQAAPLAAGGSPGGAGPSAAPPIEGGVFGPTERPGEPATAGMMTSGSAVSQAPEEALRILYSRFPHPTIARLLSVQERQNPNR